LVTRICLGIAILVIFIFIGVIVSGIKDMYAHPYLSGATFDPCVDVRGKQPILLIGGEISRSGHVKLFDSSYLHDGMPNVVPGEYKAVFTDWEGKDIQATPFLVSFFVENTPQDPGYMGSAFVYPRDALMLSIQDPSGKTLATVNTHIKLLRDALHAVPDKAFFGDAKKERGRLLKKIDELEPLYANHERDGIFHVLNELKGDDAENLNYQKQTSQEMTWLEVGKLIDAIILRLNKKKC
jgi:hypothetical protein